MIRPRFPNEPSGSHLTGEFQPDTSSHVIRFLDIDHFESVKGPVHGFGISVRLEPAAPGALR